MMHEMKDIIDSNGIENAVAMKEFKECVENCRECAALFTIRQGIILPNGQLQTTTVSERSFPITASIFLQNEHIIARLFTDEYENVSKMSEDWETTVARNTKQMLDNKKPDYVLTIDLVKDKGDNSGIHYLISLADPIFASKEEKAFVICFPLHNMRFEIVQVDVVEVYNETEYEIESRSDEEPYDGVIESHVEDGEFDENADFISNDDVLDNEI